MGHFGAAVKNDTTFDGNMTSLGDEISKLAAGVYRLSYDVRMGIWRAFRPGEASDALTPTYPGTCPSAIRSVRFSELTTFHGLTPSLDLQPETTRSCAVTASITHEIQACAATVGEVQEISLSSRM
ncbi:hypothetical protein D7B24_009552 [Verticillium nonalfalfae]|uniref:Uncharacterized protein n=1 Tax=Verticillium nonalfalfae TaxID=1051616 RepID=A0A3M9Y685_9PEZI|nr:uncharacterized protein D7B24_009552 [Verticillium nonalfalfae]RNJ54660.1 hypothetical protein D7B24_009552 [Verticillium nonalfalfae]